MTLTEADAIEVLKTVEDPEIHLDIYTLGLIYKIAIKKNTEIVITMTLTTPACPFGPMIIEQVKDRLQDKGFKNPVVDITFDPVWQPSDDVRMMLGLL